MTEHLVPSGTAPARSAWDSMQPYDIARFGEVILDPDERRRWCTAILIGGLPYIWNTIADESRRTFLTQLAVQPGDRVLLIGEGIEAIGIDEEIGALAGSEGEVVTIDFLEQVRNLVADGQWPQWHWTLADAFADGEFDAIAVFQGVAHSDDWRVTAEHLLRVLKPGGMIVLGEVCFGPPMARVIRQDAHVHYVFTKIWEALFPGQAFEDQPYWSPEELDKAFAGLVDEPGSAADAGVELFWGRNPAR